MKYKVNISKWGLIEKLLKLNHLHKVFPETKLYSHIKSIKLILISKTVKLFFDFIQLSFREKNGLVHKIFPLVPYPSLKYSDWQGY